MPPDTSPQTTQATALGRRGLFALVTLGVVALVIDGFDTQLAAFAAPAILREWHIDKLAFAPVFAAALGGMIVGATAGGALGDRFGRRTVVILSTVGFGIGTVLVSFAGSVPQIILLRFLSGIGFGAVLPNIFSLIAEWVPDRSQGTVVTISTIGVPVGGMTGAAIVAAVMPLAGWRACFAGAGVATLLFAVALFFGLKESPAFLAGQHRGAGNALPVSALFSRAWARRSLGLAIASLCAGYLGYAFGNWVPVMLSMAGLPLGTAISGSFFFNLFAIVGALAMAALIPLLGSRLALSGSLLVFAAATLAVSPVLRLTQSMHAGWTVALVMATLCAIGFGVGALASTTFTLAVHAYPTSLRATGSGFANGLNRAGAFLTPFFGAWLLDTGGNRTDGFMLSVLAAIAIAVLGTLIYDAHIRASADVSLS